MKEPQVSIVIVAYNQAHLIGQAIESCLTQTYTNLQVIVADDGSTDGTQQVVTEFAKRDSRVIPVLSGVNRGITANAQSGLMVATGDFVAFMGGDDYYYPNKIERHLYYMLADPELSLTYCQCNVVIGSDPQPIRVTSSSRKAAVTNVYQLAKGKGVDIPGPSPVVRRDCIPEHGFCIKIPTASDW